MKKIWMFIAALMLVAMLGACAVQQSPVDQNTPDKPTESASDERSPTESTADENPVYSFEFTDINGKVHKLSDYEGKPVYLKVWASWCGVCVSGLDSFNELAGEDKDYVILSVVMPSLYGEKSREEFKEWYDVLGYDNIVVMYDDTGQIVNDFGISAFPSQIMFDAEGRIVYGAVGEMSKDMVDNAMQMIIDRS